jgi:hypothetical protein
VSEKRKLAYRDRYVKYIIQTLSDRFDLEPDFPTLPFVDLSSRVPLVYRVNAREYTQILSAIMTGGDLAFPDIAHELELIWTYPDLFEPEEDTCLDYETSDSTIIHFEPQDPWLEPDFIPEAYIMPPFWVVGGLVPEFLPDWFADLIDDIIEEFTGYLPTDVLCTIGSLPISLDIEGILDLLENGLPRFTITVEGAGHVELHLLQVPLGGRLLVSTDVEFDIMDIINGIVTDGFNLIELERDFSSTPPEIDATHIEEIILDTSGTHTIYCTFLPVLDLDAFPVKFGGGIRKIVWCADAIPDEECPECDIETVLEDTEFLTTEYLPTQFGDYATDTATEITELETAYDGTPQSVAPDVPAAAPNVVEKNALCYAIAHFADLYASQKLCSIQSKNFLQMSWTRISNAANFVWNSGATLLAGSISVGLFDCLVSDDDAITALSDTGAAEELGCFLYDELKGGSMSQTAFEDALEAAVTGLTGNAQSIACLMQGDADLATYLMFLKAYNIALLRQIAGDDLPCPCETPLTYWMLYKDFRNGDKCGTYPVVWNGGGNDGHWAGNGWQFNPSAATTLNVAFGFDLGGSFVVRAFGERAERQISDGNGTNDTSINFMFLGDNGTGTSFQMNTNGIAISGANVEVGVFAALNVTENRSIHHRARCQQAASDSAARLRVHQMVYWGLPDGSGNKPPGSVWAGNTLPATIAGLFP